MKELKIKIWNVKNVVLMEVLQQDESVRHKLIIHEGKNGIDIESDDFPDLYRYRICIWGSDKEFDDRISSFEFDTIEEAEEYIEKVKETVREYNKHINKILTENEQEYLSAVIKPFRHKVEGINKLRNGEEKAYLNIILNDTHAYLPDFKIDNMYKGMELDRIYTLEELEL